MSWRKYLRESLVAKCLATFLCYMIVLLPIGPVASSFAEEMPVSAEEMLQNGIQLYEDGQYKDAIAQLQGAQTTMLDNYAIPLYAGLCFMQLHEYDKAIASFDNYLRLNPEGDEAASVRQNLTLVRKEFAKQQAKMLVSEELKMEFTPESDKTVAIADFANTGDSQYSPLSRGLAAMIIYDLSLVDTINVVDRLRVQALVDEMNLRDANLMASGKTENIGKMLQAGKVVPGQFLATEKDLGIFTNVIDVRTQQELAKQTAQGAMEDFYKIEKDIAFDILESLGAGRNTLAAPVLQNVEHVHTKNLAAFTAFSAGVMAMDNEDYPEARKQFEDALDEDDEFFLAKRYLDFLPLAIVSIAAVIAALESSAPAKAAAVGSVTGAASTGISGWAIAGGVAAVAAVGAGAAVAVSSSSSSDDGGSTLTSRTILGNWNFSGTSKYGSSDSGTMVFYDNGRITANGRNSKGSGSWSLSGTNLTIHWDAGAVYNGTASGNSNRFTMVSSNGWTLNFSR